MQLNLKNLLLLVSVSLLMASPAVSQPLLDDQFDDDDVTTNTLGIGGAWNPTAPNTVSGEAGGVYSLQHLGGAQSMGILSQDLFTANSATPLVVNFTYNELVKTAGSWYAGLVSNAEPRVNDDGFDSAVHNNTQYVKNAGHKAGLHIALAEREDIVAPGTGTLLGDESRLIYTVEDGQSFELANWTFDRTVFSVNEDEVGNTRSDNVDRDLIIDDLQIELTSDSSGWGLRFFSSDDSALLPADMSGTWAAAGVLADDPTLSALSSVVLNAYGAQSANTLVEIDRVYVDDEPQRDADDSGSDYTWGARATTVGSWGTDPGWQVGGVDTASVPDVITASRSADAVQVLGGTVNVDAADQGAWDLQIDSGATVGVATGRTLEIIENVSGGALNIDAGGELNIAGTVVTPSISGGGDVTFSNGTLSVVESGTIASASTTSDGTIANSREVVVDQLTVGAGDTLSKQKGGALVLSQAGGANSLAAGSLLNSEGGTIAAVNDAVNNALDQSTVVISGGGLTLSSSAAGVAGFDNAVVVNTSGTIKAAQVTGALAGEAVTLGGTNGISLSTGSTGVIDTADGYSLNVAGDISGAGTIAIADGANVSLDGNITTSFVEVRGDSSNVSINGTLAPANSLVFVPTTSSPNMTFTPDLSGSYDVVIDGGTNPGVDGSLALTGSAGHTGTTRIVRGALALSSAGPDGDFDMDGDVDGADFLTWQRNPAVGDLADFQANYGYTGGGGNLPSASNVLFEGVPVTDDGRRDAAVIMVGDAATALTIGAGAGEVQWAGSGGFAAAGAGTHTVTLDGGSALNWSSATAGFNGHQLQLGSAVATGKVELTNDINLENGARVIEVIDNEDSNDDSSEISGVISGGGSDGRLVIMGPDATHGGLLSLTGANSFDVLEIRQNTVHATDGVGLPSTALLQFNTQFDIGAPVATFATSGTFTRNIGSGPGEVSWALPDPLDTVPSVPDSGSPTEGGGGFAAVGGDLTVSLNGGATIDAFDPNSGFNNLPVHLGSNVATGVTNFANDVDAGAGTRMLFIINGNPLDDDDKVVISGNYTGFSNLRFDGSGRVEFAGTATIAGSMTVISYGFPPAADAENFQELFITGDVVLNDSTGPFSTDLFVNGTLSVDQFLTARRNNAFGGSGTIFMADNDLDGASNQQFGAQRDSILRPGADYDTVGTLTFDLSIPAGSPDTVAGLLQLSDFFIYEMELENNGGSVDHDSIDVLSDGDVGLIKLSPNAGDEFFLELEALNDLTGALSASDEFELFTWNENVDFAIEGVVQGAETSGTLTNVFINSDDLDVSGATVNFEVLEDFSGRLYVTGLALSGAITAAGSAVPEPSSCVAAALAAVASLCSRRRNF